MTNKTDIKLEKITPQIAAQLLKDTEESAFNNRPLSKITTLKYGNDMAKGHWNADTTETVKLALMNKKPIVIDGQHRLNAVIMSGKTLPMWIARYVPVDAFAHIDQGKARTLEDLMAIKGWRHHSILAKSGRDLWRLSTTGNAALRSRGETAASEGTMLDFIERHHYEKLLETYDTYEEFFRLINKDKIAAKYWMLYLAYHWQQVDEKKCDVVLDYLADTEGEAAPTKEFGWAVKAIRRTRMQQVEGSKLLQTNRLDMHNYTMQQLSVAFNCYRRGKTFEDSSEFKHYTQNKDNKGIPITI